jgi:hypothetical protein
MDRLDNNIGRYPLGFRHYENFENYRTVFPDASIEQYHHDLNKQCEYQEFKEINKQAFLYQSKQPYFKFSHKMFEDHENIEETPEAFVYSDVITFLIAISRCLKLSAKRPSKCE